MKSCVIALLLLSAMTITNTASTEPQISPVVAVGDEVQVLDMIEGAPRTIGIVKEIVPNPNDGPGRTIHYRVRLHSPAWIFDFVNSCSVRVIRKGGKPDAGDDGRG
jgi:hypothetical protein